jgi:hypothetical protein
MTPGLSFLIGFVFGFVFWVVAVALTVLLWPSVSLRSLL